MTDFRDQHQATREPRALMDWLDLSPEHMRRDQPAPPHSRRAGGESAPPNARNCHLSVQAEPARRDLGTGRAKEGPFFGDTENA
jgi:hypothetical protein